MDRITALWGGERDRRSMSCSELFINSLSPLRLCVCPCVFRCVCVVIDGFCRLDCCLRVPNVPELMRERNLCRTIFSFSFLQCYFLSTAALSMKSSFTTFLCYQILHFSSLYIFFCFDELLTPPSLPSTLVVTGYSLICLPPPSSVTLGHSVLKCVCVSVQASVCVCGGSPYSMTHVASDLQSGGCSLMFTSIKMCMTKHQLLAPAPYNLP